MSFKITGRNPTGKLLQGLKASGNYKDGTFQNLSPTPMTLHDASYYDILKKFLFKNRDTKPGISLPSIKTNLKNIRSKQPLIIWFGHSSYFLRVHNKNILVDPVFSGNASPLSFMVHAFPGSDIYTAEDFPQIDLLILTHDHYDHLDYKTLKELKSKINMICCPLGVSSHLTYWGFREDQITEMDWWQTTTLAGELHLTAAPARHFSGRGISRFKTLWCSYILRSPDCSIYLGGDSGYDRHFKEIGDKFGPFDVAILESGQYNTAWPLIHMMPEQTVQAAVDLQARLLLPLHWGKFTLALHAWDEPVKRVLEAAGEKNVAVATPMIGQPIILGEEHPAGHWWELKKGSTERDFRWFRRGTA